MSSGALFFIFFFFIFYSTFEMRRNSTLSDTNSDSSMSSAFSAYSADDLTEDRTPTSNSKQFFTNLVQKTRSQVEQKTSEINATMQEKLPEWKQRGALYSSKAKETGIEWSRRGKEAVDRWKKDRAGLCVVAMLCVA